MSWAKSRQAQVLRWLSTTPAQRLGWLEDAIEFARAAGATPRSSEKHHTQIDTPLRPDQDLE